MVTPSRLGAGRCAHGPVLARTIVAALAAAGLAIGSVQPALAEASPTLLVSSSPDGTDAQPLAGATLHPQSVFYVEYAVPADSRLVKFYLDDTSMRSEPITRDTDAPFVSSVGGSDEELAVGEHQLTARVKKANGTNVEFTASFSVRSSASAPLVTLGPATALSRDAAPVVPVAEGSVSRPSIASTGVRAGAKLTPSGSLTVRTDGAVIEGLNIDGSLTVQADNVTVRDVKVRTGASYGIDIAKGSSGTVIENVEVEMLGNTGNAAIGNLGDHSGVAGKEYGDNVTVRRSYLHGNGDGIKVANYSLYEQNYIAMRRGPGSIKHIDGIQASGRTNWAARYNWLDQAYSGGHNAAIFQQAYTGTKDVYVNDVIIEKNWVNGGVYTIQTEDGKTGSGWLRNVRIEDNVFYRDYKYGVYRPRGDVRGNGGTWADTGQPVTSGRL